MPPRKKPDLEFKRLHPKAKAPFKATEGAAGLDLTAIGKKGNLYSTGIAFGIPEDHVVLVFSRSSHGFKEDTRLSNCVGVIDSDYTGEVKVKLRRDDGNPLTVQVGERVAQAVCLPLANLNLVEVDELKQTTRGAKGFGSTGK